jgi:hypothetical protein
MLIYEGILRIIDECIKELLNLDLVDVGNGSAGVVPSTK